MTAARRASSVLVAAVCGALLLGGCGTGAGADSPLATHPRPDHGMDALLSGRLAEIDGCLLIETEGGAVLPVFPAGDAEWTEGALHRRGTVYEIGDPIDLGGGFGGRPSDATVPSGCPQTTEVFLVSPY